MWTDNTRNAKIKRGSNRRSIDRLYKYCSDNYLGINIELRGIKLTRPVRMNTPL